MNIYEIFERIAGPVPGKQTVSSVKPARRHGCDVCKKPFICHLCTLDHTTHVHTNPYENEDTLIYVCWGCCQTHLLYRFTWRHYMVDPYDEMRQYDLLTGQWTGNARARRHGE